MFDDLLGKMQEAQQQMEQSKKQLDDVYVEGEAEGGLVKVTCTANRKLTNIIISEKLLDDKEAIEDLVMIAVNRALAEAEKVFDSKMQSVAQNMIPPGMM